MNDLPTERVAYIRGIRPRPSKGGMPEQEFLKLYGRWRFARREIMDGVERYEQVIHCVACMCEDSSGVIHAFRMMAEVEKDLLGNFPSIMKLTCHGCGVNELVPCAEKIEEHYESPTYEEAYKLWKQARRGIEGHSQYEMQMQQMRAMQQAAQGIGSMGGSLFGGGGNAGPPSQAMTATEVEIRQREKITRLAERYGVSSKIMKLFGS